MEKYTKKATARILKEVLKVNPKASGHTTFDQAFVTLMTHWNLELGIETDSNNMTTCTLYRDSDKPKIWKLKDVWDQKEGDWDWNTVYKTILESVIKEKLYKRPKLGKRALAKLEKEKSVKPVIVENDDADVMGTAKLTKIKQVESIEDLKKRKGNLQVKKSDWKKKGKDISEIEKEIDDINNTLKKLTKTK